MDVLAPPSTFTLSNRQVPALAIVLVKIVCLNSPVA